jgi:Na+/alanine symporter
MYLGFFRTLQLVTFPLHLLLMNAMLGSAGIALIQHFSKEKMSEKLSKTISSALPVLLAFIVNLGVAPLLFLQVIYGHFVYTSAILMGLFRILIIPILVIAYFLSYLYHFRFSDLKKGRIVVIGIVVIFWMSRKTWQAMS